MVLLENYAAHKQNWAKCFNDPQMSDVVFEAKDGQTFHCEKFVLEVASPYFKKLFDGKCGGPSKYVAAKDVDPAALKWILRACYTGDGEVDDDNVVSVMVAAGLYEMDWVEKACMKYLTRGRGGGPLASFKYSEENEKWQVWKVPEAGWYHMAALGAKAPDQAKLGQWVYWAKGGEGAMIGGSFELQAGDVVQILTGGMSKLLVSGKYKNGYSGGGGGTFIALKKEELSLLLAAGGGGSVDYKYYGGDGSLNENGTSADPKSVGGKSGGNGADNGQHKGGLGWKAGPAALAKPRGAAENGGFGGGGNLCGGGGGYSGGSGGCYNGGGGGGSYVAPQAENVWKKVGSLSHGKVFIWKAKKAPVEEVFFLKEIGDISAESQSNEEAIDSWEILE